MVKGKDVKVTMVSATVEPEEGSGYELPPRMLTIKYQGAVIPFEKLEFFLPADIAAIKRKRASEQSGDEPSVVAGNPSPPKK